MLIQPYIYKNDSVYILSVSLLANICFNDINENNNELAIHLANKYNGYTIDEITILNVDNVNISSKLKFYLNLKNIKIDFVSLRMGGIKETRVYVNDENAFVGLLYNGRLLFQDYLTIKNELCNLYKEKIRLTKSQYIYFYNINDFENFARYINKNFNILFNYHIICDKYIK